MSVNVTAPDTLSIDNETYILQNDISASGTAITISGNNIIFDLNGFAINYNSGAAGSGIYVTGDNVNIKNGFITQGANRDGNSPAIYITSTSSGSHAEYLIIQVAGDITGSGQNAPGILINGSGAEIDHCFIRNNGTTSNISYAPRGIYIDERNYGGFNLHDNIIIGPHQGISADYVGLNTYGTYPANPQRSYINDNFIQHTRTGGTKSPYGIAFGKCWNFEIKRNQILSDDGRGIILDGLGDQAMPGCRFNDVSNNRIDVEYSQEATTGGYVENHCYGLATRYNSGDNNFSDNFIHVGNITPVDSGTDVRITAGLNMGSDTENPQDVNIIMNNNIIIISDDNTILGRNNVFRIQALYANNEANNNQWYLLANDFIYYNDNWTDNGSLELLGNTELSPASYTPSTPIGLQLRKFGNNYFLTWSDNNTVYGESQTWEYRVYKDGSPITGSTKHTLSWVDTDVTGTHTYQLRAINLNGQESSLSTSISTTSALDGWSGSTPVADTPDVTTQAATNITTGGARLNGSVNPNNAETTYHFEYGLTTSYGSNTSNVSAGSGSSPVSVYADISSLDDNQTYHFRLVATNSEGTTYGADLTFTTDEIVVTGDIYVSNSGSNSNTGTLASPFLTIQYAIDQAVAGDIIYVLDGTYAPATITNRDFSLGNEVQILAYSGRPVITGGNFTFSGSSYLKLQGFEFDACEVRIHDGSTNITVEGNLCHHSRFLISIMNSSYNVIKNNEVYGSDLGEATGAGEVGIQIYNSHYNLVDGNECYNTFFDYEQGDGIGVFWNSSYNIIRNNILHDNPDDNLDGWYSGAHNVIENNVFYRAGYNQYGNTNAGNGKGCKTNYESADWILRFNVAYDNKYEGFSDEDAGGNNTFYNNTAYNNGLTNYYNFTAGNGLLFKNNLSCGLNLSSLFTGNGNLAETSFATCDPWFVDAANNNFRPVSGATPLIDQGVALTTTTSSGSNTTTVNVGSARYFIDGFGITEGDLIKVGSNNAVRITNVNYTTNVLTVATAISYNNGDSVNITFNDSAPDIGAFEFLDETIIISAQGQATTNSTILGVIKVFRKISGQATAISYAVISNQITTRRRFIC